MFTTFLKIVGAAILATVFFGGIIVIYQILEKPEFLVSQEVLDDDGEFTLSDEWYLVKGANYRGEKLSYDEFMKLVEEDSRHSIVWVSKDCPEDWRK